MPDVYDNVLTRCVGQVRGNLRAPRDQVFDTVVQGVKQMFGDKYQVFLIPDPDSEEQDPKGGPRCVSLPTLPYAWHASSLLIVRRPVPTSSKAKLCKCNIPVEH